MSKSRKLYGATALGLIVLFTAAVNFADRNITPVPDSFRQMAALPNADPAPAPTLVASAQADTASGARFGLGRPALPEEIAAWDVDVRPDGTGLPEGSGDVWTGEELFVANCASCHGDFAEGVGNWPALAGGEGTLADDDPVKTVGSYWPHLSTVWDYVHRSMPFGNAQSLSTDDVYAITAYILYSNFIVEDDFVLTHENFLEVEMPNADGFIVDDRDSAEYPMWRTDPCMENCKDAPVTVTMRATVLDVTPEDSGVPADGAAVTGTAPEVALAAASPDPALVEAGEKVFRQCSACHQVGASAQSRVGPHLNGIVGREIGALDGFKYSSAMAGMDGTWDEETLAAFLADPRGTVPGTRMAFAGLRSEADIAALRAYLATFGE